MKSIEDIKKEIEEIFEDGLHDIRDRVHELNYDLYSEMFDEIEEVKEKVVKTILQDREEVREEVFADFIKWASKNAEPQIRHGDTHPVKLGWVTTDVVVKAIEQYKAQINKEDNEPRN